MKSAVRKSVFAGFAGLSLIGSVAGCAPSASQDTPAQAPTTPVTTTAPTTGTGTTSGGSVYKDGTYSADGTYVSPNGTETVGVELAIESDTVKAVNITTHPTNPNTKKFQGEFAGGIAGQIVGKKIDELNVSKVAGSSLTSGGFNDALASIKAEAS